MVGPIVDEIPEPIVKAEEQVVAPVVDMDEDIAMLFGDDDFEDDSSEGFDEEEVWEVNKEWQMAPVTPPPMPAVQPPSIYEVRGPSTMAAKGPSFPLPTPGLPTPPSVIEDLTTRLSNPEYEHGQLVKKVIQVSDAEVAAGVTIGEIGPRVGAQVEQGQQTATQRDEVIVGLTQQVQALQEVVQQRDTRIQQLQTMVSEMSSRESTLMQCILGMDRSLRWVEAEMVSPEVKSEKWRRLLLPWMHGTFNVSTGGREEDFFPRNGM
ncbi:hypothetical protein Tco_1228160 [Tanacetum coccineum]